MIADDIAHCQRRIRMEESSARDATTADQRERHLQVAMLYRAQLAVLERKLQQDLNLAA
jgi:uncharacterized protein YeaC (DUF1315 family)